MKLSEILRKSFIIEKDGTQDKYYILLGNCFQQCLYLIAKCENEKKIKNIYYNLFVDNINLSIKTDKSNPVYRFRVNSFGGCYDAFDISYYEETGESARKLLENLLDEGQPVAMGTILDQAEFSIRYNSDFVYNSLRPGHIFTIAAHDKEYFYLADNSDFIRMDKVEMHPSNNGIYMIKKEYMTKPFSSYFNCWTAKINFEKIHDTFYDASYMQSVLEKVVLSYNSETYIDESLNVVNGRNAIVYLIELCQSENVDTEANILPGTYTTIYGQMIWQLGYLYNNREIFLEFLKRNFEEIYKNHNIKVLFKKSSQSIDILKNVLIKQHIKEQFMLDKKLEKYLVNWLADDDALFKALSELVGVQK